MEYLRLRCYKESLNKFICFEAELAKPRFVSSCICYKPSASQVIRAWLKWIFFSWEVLDTLLRASQAASHHCHKLKWDFLHRFLLMAVVENPLQWEEGEILQRWITQMFRMSQRFTLCLLGSILAALSQCISALALHHRAQVSAPGFVLSLDTF